MNFRSTPPEVTDFVRLRLPGVLSEKLAEGLTLHSIYSSNCPANNISIIWNSGVASAPVAAPLVPPMLMQGTHVLSAADIIDRLDFLGTFLSNNTFTAHTQMEAMCLSDFTPRVLDIVQDILLCSSFPSDRFEAIRRKELSRLDLLMARNSYVASTRLSALLAGQHHPYVCEPKRADLENLSLQDVIRSWEQGIFSSQIDIYAAGDISSRIRKGLLLFAKTIEANRRTPSLLPPPVLTPFKPEKPGIRHICRPDSVQSAIAMGIPTIGRDHPDYIPLRFAITALGGYFGSRLMTVIREQKGLTYGINAYLMGSHEGASINIYAECDPANTDIVINEIRNEMWRMQKSLMPYDEFRRLRSYYATTLTSVLETFKSVSSYYQGILTVGYSADYFLRQQDYLHNFTPNDICRVAQSYFHPEAAIIVVAGP